MTTDAQIQIIPAAIYNGTITKLEKRLAASWGLLERAVQSKDITATRAAVNRVAHLEELRQRHVALEQRIAETISNSSPGQTAPLPDSITIRLPAQPAPVLERNSIDLSIQTAPVLESTSNGLSIQTAPVPHSSNGSSTQSAPVPDRGPSIQPAPVLPAPVQHALVPEISNGSSTQTAPVPGKGNDLPQPEVQSPVARPKKKPVRPVEIKFGSIKKHIRYATEIPVAIANWLIEQGKELPITANFIHPSDAGFSQSATTKKLKSGQFMRVGHNQEALLHKARELLDGCGYEGVQIKVLLDNGITLSA